MPFPPHRQQDQGKDWPKEQPPEPHKIARGYIPVKTYSIHWLADIGFHDAVGRSLEAERLDVDNAIKALGSHSPYRQG